MLTFNLQRMLDDETELAAMAYVRHGTRKAYSGDVELDSGSVEGVLNSNSSNQTSYGGSVNLTKLLDQHQITAGVSADLAEMRYGAQQAADCSTTDRHIQDCDPAKDTAGVRGKSYSVGVYASDTWTVNDRTFVTGAARFNHANVSNTITRYLDSSGNFQSPEVLPRESFNYNSLNPSLGVSYKLAPTITAFGNVGQSNRIPTIIELGCADEAHPCSLPTGLQADPYLKQVIAQTIELGTRWRGNDSEFTVAVYRSDNRDDILFQPTSTVGGFGYFSNFSKTRRQGVDLSARTELGAWSVQASYNYLDATYQADGELFGGEREIAVSRGTRIAGLPKHTLRVSADWKATPELTVGGTAVAVSSIVTQGNEDGHIGEDPNPVAADASVKGYALLNLHANYQAAKGLDYFARINNVFDTHFATYGMMGTSLFDSAGVSLSGNSTFNRFVAPGAPRSLMVGLRYRF